MKTDDKESAVTLIKAVHNGMKITKPAVNAAPDGSDAENVTAPLAQLSKTPWRDKSDLELATIKREGLSELPNTPTPQDYDRFNSYNLAAKEQMRRALSPGTLKPFSVRPWGIMPGGKTGNSFD